MNFSTELEQYGVLGMKWGKRRGNREARGGVSRVAAATSNHYGISAAAKMTFAAGYAGRNTKRDKRLNAKAQKIKATAKEFDTITKNSVAAGRLRAKQLLASGSKVPLKRIEKNINREIQFTKKMTESMRRRAAALEAKTNSGKSAAYKKAADADLAAANRLLAGGKMTSKDLTKAFYSVGIPDLVFTRER